VGNRSKLRQKLKKARKEQLQKLKNKKEKEITFRLRMEKFGLFGKSILFIKPSTKIKKVVYFLMPVIWGVYFFWNSLDFYLSINDKYEFVTGETIYEFTNDIEPSANDEELIRELRKLKKQMAELQSNVLAKTPTYLLNYPINDRILHHLSGVYSMSGLPAAETMKKQAKAFEKAYDIEIPMDDYKPKHEYLPMDKYFLSQIFNEIKITNELSNEIQKKYLLRIKFSKTPISDYREFIDNTDELRSKFINKEVQNSGYIEIISAKNSPFAQPIPKIPFYIIPTKNVKAQEYKFYYIANKRVHKSTININERLSVITTKKTGINLMVLYKISKAMRFN